MFRRLFIFGASGHAKVVIEVVLRSQAGSIALIVDDDPARTGTDLVGYRVAGRREDLLRDRALLDAGIVAIGSNAARLEVAAALAKAGLSFTSAIDPSAVVSTSARIGAGSLVMPLVAVNADARIGEHVIVNTGASIDHDCNVGDGVHLAPGSRLCGGVTVDRGAFIGAGTVVVPGIRIGAGAVVGAGSTVLGDIGAGERVAGSPCRVLGEGL